MLVSIKENAVFRRLYYRGDSAGSRLLMAYVRRNRLGCNRLGLTVSTKLGHAVVRNRVRRRLREVYRLNEQKLVQGYDIVLVARSAAVEAEFSQLTAAFLSAMDRLGLLKKEV